MIKQICCKQGFKGNNERKLPRNENNNREKQEIKLCLYSGVLAVVVVVVVALRFI